MRDYKKDLKRLEESRKEYIIRIKRYKDYLSTYEGTLKEIERLILEIKRKIKK